MPIVAHVSSCNSEKPRTLEQRSFTASARAHLPPSPEETRLILTPAPLRLVLERGFFFCRRIP
jgi:hypothetical protein